MPCMKKKLITVIYFINNIPTRFPPFFIIIIIIFYSYSVDTACKRYYSQLHLWEGREITVEYIKRKSIKRYKAEKEVGVNLTQVWVKLLRMRNPTLASILSFPALGLILKVLLSFPRPFERNTLGLVRKHPKEQPWSTYYPAESWTYCLCEPKTGSFRRSESDEGL